MSTTSHTTTHAATDTVQFGFWLYLLTDLIIFAVLFATFAVLRNGISGHPALGQLFDLDFVLLETLLLLTSSFTSGIGMLAVRAGRKTLALAWFGLTFALGIGFLGMELYEFSHLIHQGYTWQTSASLSAFYTLVGTHGLHIGIGLLWLAILLGYVWRRGVTESASRKLNLLSIYWHFLDIVWIFIFTIVYLWGVMS